MSTPAHQVLTRHLDRDSDRAIFRQIADHLRDAISSGRLEGGDKLPTEPEIGDHYGVTRPTARNALELLGGEGLIEPQHGRGWFVRMRPTMRTVRIDRFARRHRDQGRAAFLAEVEEAGSAPAVDQFTVREQKAPAEVVSRLGLEPAARVVVRSRRYLIDGRPVETATSYVPAHIARGTAIAKKDSGPGGIYARLEELGHELDHFTEQISARMPSAAEVRKLQLPASVPVFHLIRTAYDKTGGAVEVCDTVMSSEVYVLDYRLPAI